MQLPDLKTLPKLPKWITQPVLAGLLSFAALQACAPNPEKNKDTQITNICQIVNDKDCKLLTDKNRLTELSKVDIASLDISAVVENINALQLMLKHLEAKIVLLKKFSSDVDPYTGVSNRDLLESLIREVKELMETHIEARANDLIVSNADFVTKGKAGKYVAIREVKNAGRALDDLTGGKASEYVQKALQKGKELSVQIKAITPDKVAENFDGAKQLLKDGLIEAKKFAGDPETRKNLSELAKMSAGNRVQELRKALEILKGKNSTDPTIKQLEKELEELEKNLKD